MAKKGRLRLGPKWKAVIGFFGAVLLFGLLVWGIAQFESQARVKQAQEELEASASTQAQCYTPTVLLPFTTGDWEVDSALAWALENPEEAGLGGQEPQGFVVSAVHNIKAFKQGEVFQKAQELNPVQEDQNPYRLSVDGARNFHAQKTPDTRTYSQVSLPRANANGDDLVQLRFIGEKDGTTYSTQVSIPISQGEESQEPLKIPVISWGESAEGKDFKIVEALPLCTPNK